MFPIDNIKSVSKIWGMQPPWFYLISKYKQPNLFTKNTKFIWLENLNNASYLFENHGFLKTNENGEILDMFSIVKSSNSNFSNWLQNLTIL